MQTQEHNTRQTLVVDLDGTLVLSDMLIENFFLFIRLYPFRLFQVALWLLRGKAYFKMRLADAVLPDTSTLPYNQPLIEWLKIRQLSGVRLVLATASDWRIAKSIAAKVGLFDEVLGTKGEINLSSTTKRDTLISLFGEHGYEYVGNSKADLAVWRSAEVIHVANPGPGVLAAARRIGNIGQVFDARKSFTKALIKALRIHQWVKNLLIFVPLLSSHRFLEIALVQQGIVAFFSFGLCASSVYLLNDLFDLQADRQHHTKRFRPFASGTLPISYALVLIPLLLCAAFVLSSCLLPFSFVGILAGYFCLTLAYSLWLKRIVMLDVVTLALLYALRVIAGTAAMTSLSITFWILAFCMFLFLSLAFVKRYTELHDARANGKTTKSAGRGYYPTDTELLASLGGASGYIAVLVLALYINESSLGTLYNSPQWMWMACPLLLFWVSRVWLIAHRGEMHDDPIVFAIRDTTSLVVGILFLAVFFAAA